MPLIKGKKKWKEKSFEIFYGTHFFRKKLNFSGALENSWYAYELKKHPD